MSATNTKLNVKELVAEIRELNALIAEARSVPGLSKDYDALIKKHTRAVYKLTGYRPARSC